MPRPSITGETIVVQVENDILAWTDGLLSCSNHSYVKTAKWLSRHNIAVDITPDGPVIEANLDDPEHPEQALAAMMGVVPGRGRILEAPDAVLALLPYPQVDETELDTEDEEEDPSMIIVNQVVSPDNMVIRVSPPEDTVN